MNLISFVVLPDELASKFSSRARGRNIRWWCGDAVACLPPQFYSPLNQSSDQSKDVQIGFIRDVRANKTAAASASIASAAASLCSQAASVTVMADGRQQLRLVFTLYQSPASLPTKQCRLSNRRRQRLSWQSNMPTCFHTPSPDQSLCYPASYLSDVAAASGSVPASVATTAWLIRARKSLPTAPANHSSYFLSFSRFLPPTLAFSRLLIRLM